MQLCAGAMEARGVWFCELDYRCCEPPDMGAGHGTPVVKVLFFCRTVSSAAVTQYKNVI